MAEFLLELLFYVILLPLSLIIATPFVLIMAVFPQGGYWHNVKRYYKKVIDLWSFMW